MKVGTADKLTASGAAAAREIMERKLGGEGQVIEAKGQGGKIGGVDQVRIISFNRCTHMIICIQNALKSTAYIRWLSMFVVVPSHQVKTTTIYYHEFLLFFIGHVLLHLSLDFCQIANL